MKGPKMNPKEDTAVGASPPLTAEVRIGGVAQQKKGGGKPSAISADEAAANILTRQTARIARARKQMETPELVEETRVPDEMVDAFIAVEAEIASLEERITATQADQSLSSTSVRSLVGGMNEALNEARKEREAIAKAYPSITEYAKKKVGPQSEARELLKALRTLAGGRVRGEDVGNTIIRWSEAGVIVDQQNGPLSWRVGREEHTYGCAYSENALIMEAFAALVTFVSGWKKEAEARAEKAAEPVKEFLIEHGELGLLKENSVRIIPFLTGDEPGGNVCVLYVTYGDDKLGEVVLERVNSELVVRKVARTFAAMQLFGNFGTDPRNPNGRKIWRKRGSIRVPFPKLVDAGEGETPPRFDLSTVSSPALRVAIEERVAADWRYKIRGDRTHEFFGKIEDISSIDPRLLVTVEDLRHGRCRPGSVAIVKIAWQNPGSEKRLHGRIDLELMPDARSFRIRGETETVVNEDGSTGKQWRVTGLTPDNLAEGVKWLAQHFSAMPLSELDSKLWLSAQRQGAEFERDTFAPIAAERYNAMPLTKDNVQEFSALEGGDGTYVISHDFRGVHAKHSTPVLYVVKKEGGKLTIVWALPGVSERSVRDDVGQAYDMDDLPRTIRGTIRNQLKFRMGWRGTEGMEKVRELFPHLLVEVAEADDNAPETVDGEDNGHKENGGEQ